ncbi:HlyD family secretion protein [Pseudoxanthomonas winnipegensis]|uniref:HlyD family secretion protein n=1 Tax=Pseudoxanthomonas winnipegensis TaxID=2480810 RepID=UPI0030F4A6D4
MSQPLFRAEVLEARRASGLGGISLAQPLAGIWLTGATVLVAGAVVAFLCIGTYSRRSTVMGQLVPSKGLATVLAPATGVISRMDVEEGAYVKAGQVLGVVSVPSATLVDGDTHAALERRLDQRAQGLRDAQAAQLAQLDEQASGLRAQLATADAELVHLGEEIATRQRQIDLTNEVLDRYRKLQDGQYVSVLQIRQQEATALGYTSDLQALQRAQLEQRRAIDQLQQQLAALPGQRQTVQADYLRESATVGQEQIQTKANSAMVFKAPVDGVIATRMAKPGQAIKTGQPLLSVLPGDDRLEAELLVPSRAIGFIEPGDAVMLRYQAYPYQKFGHQRGTVARISRSALTLSELGALSGNAQQGELYYRITVVLAKQAITAYGKPEPLRPGMLLGAEILGERRRLIEWIFEPLYSLGITRL